MTAPRDGAFPDRYPNISLATWKQVPRYEGASPYAGRHTIRTTTFSVQVASQGARSLLLLSALEGDTLLAGLGYRAGREAASKHEQS
jgi:hypothetical protein